MTQRIIVGVREHCDTSVPPVSDKHLSAWGTWGGDRAVKETRIDVCCCDPTAMRKVNDRLNDGQQVLGTVCPVCGGVKP